MMANNNLMMFDMDILFIANSVPTPIAATTPRRDARGTHSTFIRVEIAERRVDITPATASA
jgi:hypothetical protein